MNLVLLGLGVVLLLIGFFFLMIAMTVVRKMKLKTDRLVKHGNFTSATVKDHHKQEMANSKPLYYTIIEYEFQGNLVQKKGSIPYSKKPEHQKGQRLDIYHDHENPDEFVISGEEKLPTINFMTYFVIASVFCGVGLFLIFIAL